MRKRSVILISAILFVALVVVFNLGRSLSFFSFVAGAFYPVFIGVVFALMLNGPVMLLERTVFKKIKRLKLKRLFSLAVVVAVVGGFFALLVWLAAPSIMQSVSSLQERTGSFTAEGIRARVTEGGFLYNTLLRFGGTFDNLVGGLKTRLGEFLATAPKTLLNIALGLVFAVLIILGKEELCKQFFKLFKHFWGETKTRKIFASAACAAEKVSKFLVGQAIEAVVFGLTLYLLFILFKVPYAPLTALILAIGNLIPMVGAILAGAIAFTIVFTISVEKAFIGLVIVLVVQQIEQFTIYPIIVGRYVGLSSFWTLFSVIIGGALFGFWGLLLSVPVVALIDNFAKVMYARKSGYAVSDEIKEKEKGINLSNK
jgi:predicted PurR-regulated permease PerM